MAVTVIVVSLGTRETYVSPVFIDENDAHLQLRRMYYLLPSTSQMSPFQPQTHNPQFPSVNFVHHHH